MDMDPAERGGVEWVSEFCPVKGSTPDSVVWLYRGPPVCTQGLLAMLRASYLYPRASIYSEGCMAVSFSESVPPQICGVAMPLQVCGWGAAADCHPCPYGGAATARIQS